MAEGDEYDPYFNEPEVRYNASAAAIGKEVFMYRGYLESFKGKLKVSPPSRCDVFDTTVFQWSKRFTHGSNPKAWQRSSIAVFQHRIFYYGGWSGRDYTNELFELDTLASPMKWMQHRPKNPKKGPRKKEGCGFIVLPGGEELCLFAGYGVPVGRDPPGTTSLKDKRYWDGRGWTNELHCYHLAEATWRCPEQTGQRPPPGIGMTFTRVDARRVVVFAGSNKAVQRRVHDVHILAMDISIWHWSGVILPQSARQPWPEGRWYHTAYSLWDPDSIPMNPSLVVTSGLSEDAQTLGDLWVFEVNGLTWEELKLPDSVGRRTNHSGGLVYTSETTRLLVTNGGIPEDPNMYKSRGDYCIISETVISELVYSEEAAARGSCGWSVASVMKNGSKVMMDGSKVTKGQEAAVTLPGKERPEHDENPMDRKLKLEFDVMELLGKGGFGVVYRVKSKLDNGEYALKIIKLPTSKRQENDVKREVNVLMGLDHSRILRYFQSWPARILDPVILKSFEIKEDPFACAELSRYDLPAGGGGLQSAGDSSREDNEGDEQPRSKYPLCLFIQTQLCRNDTLKDWLLKNMHNRPKDVVFDYFGQILEAVVYIHSKGLLHRDLKPSNIFFSQDGGIKVGDFGLVAENISPEQSSQEQFHSGQVGTWFYMAPEQLSGQKYDQKVDIFALGVIFLELNYPLTAKERDQVHSDLRYKFELPKGFTEECPVEAALAKKLLNREAEKRPSAKDVLEELQGLKATLSGQASSSGQSFATSTQGISSKTPQDSVSTGMEMDTTDSGVGISRTQDSGGPSSVEGETPHYQPSVGAHHQNLDTTDSGVAGDSQTHSGELQPRFQGVQFLGDSPWHVSVTSEANKIEWDEIGVLFEIPKGAVPPDKVLNLTVWPCIKGPFVLPPGYQFASPVFIVGPEFKFEKKVLLQLSHFIHLQSSDDCEKMVFLSARSTSSQPTKDGNLGYRFKVLEGGSFEVGRSVGTISLSHFCAVAAGKETNAGGKVHYSLQFHQSEEVKKAFFIVSIVNQVYRKNLEDFLKEWYPRATFQLSMKQPVEFAGNEVTLHIPNPEDSMSGWVIIPDITPCKIDRKEVDFPLLYSDEVPDYPPKLALTLEQSRPPQSPFRQCKLSVGGLTEPWSFTLVLRKSKHIFGLPSASLPLSQQPTRHQTTDPWSPVTPLSPPAAVGTVPTTMDSPEYKAFQAMYATLRSGLDPSTLAPMMFSCDLLTPNERDSAMNRMLIDGDRTEEILKAVERRIRADPQAFHSFVEVLGHTEAFSALVEGLRGAYSAVKEGPPSASLPLSQQPTRHQTTDPWSPVTPLSPPPAAATDGNPGDDPILGQGDLMNITDHLRALVDKRDIRYLGIVLGLHYDRLKVIEQSSDSYLDDVIAAWLRREGDVDKVGGPRWSTLVKALQHRRLRQSGIAIDIAEAQGLPFPEQ